MNCMDACVRQGNMTTWIADNGPQFTSKASFPGHDGAPWPVSGRSVRGMDIRIRWRFYQHCLRNGWFYNTSIGGAIPKPEAENQVPLVLCNKAGLCKGQKVFARFSVVDNNQDIGCEMFIGKLLEPHILVPYPYIWNFYRDMMSGTVRVYNKFLEEKRMNIEGTMSRLMRKIRRYIWQQWQEEREILKWRR